METDRTSDWQPIADHTMTLDEVRAAFIGTFAEGRDAARRQLQAEGLPAAAVERAMELIEADARARLEADLPAIVAGMARSTGGVTELRLVSDSTQH